MVRQALPSIQKKNEIFSPLWPRLEYILCMTVRISDLVVSDQFVGKKRKENKLLTLFHSVFSLRDPLLYILARMTMKREKSKGV